MQNDQLRKYFRRTTTKLTFTTMRMHYAQRGGTSCRYFRLVSQIAIAIAILTFPSAEARWNATGTVRNLWATPIMEYSGLFSDEQLAAFATDVKTSWANFLKERSDPNRKQKVVTKSQAFGTSTKNDKDKINEEFFNYQSRNPINQATLETVWQGFVYACNRFVEETGLPPIEYQRETLAGGSIEWTTDKGPRRGNQVNFKILNFLKCLSTNLTYSYFLLFPLLLVLQFIEFSKKVLLGFCPVWRHPSRCSHPSRIRSGRDTVP